MRPWVTLLAVVFAVGLAVAQDDEKPKAKTTTKAKAKTEDDGLDLPAEANPLGKKAGDNKEVMTKVSYGIGLQFGRQFKSNGLNPDLKVFMQGIQDALGGNEPKYSEAELKAAFEAFEPIARKAMADQAKVAGEKAKAQGEKNRKAGEDFLEANKEKPGVKSLPSGLQYKVLTAGKGASPKATDTVRVHYRGKLIDGTLFDESYTGEAPTKKDQPAEFPVNGVIKGWTEALQKMKVGDKWQLVIPSELAYGERQTGPVIGPHSVLVFDVELLEVVE